MSSHLPALKGALLLASLLLHPLGQAQLYKWVDKDGKTHYSSQRGGPGSTAVSNTANAATPGAPAKPDWKERELDYQKRQAGRQDEAPEHSNRPKRLSTTYGSNQIDTEKAKCELARDVLSGAVRHGSGAVTDGNDRQIAERDVKTFCR